VRGVIPAKQKYGTRADPFAEIPAFVPGAEQHFLPPLRRAIAAAGEIDILAAFVQPGGLDAIEDDLVDALARGARVRVITGDYLGFTHPHALHRLHTLATREASLEVRLYQTLGEEAFHPKAYIFASGHHGVAFVGSSNLSRSALSDGVEWNLHVRRADGGVFDTIRRRFVHLFQSPRSSPLSPELLLAYQRRARNITVPQVLAPPPERAAPVPVPHAIQREVLAALSRAREQAESRGLVVMATGLGKTLLAAFDVAASGARRALFVAHREEILVQAAQSWGRVLPDRSVGFVTGQQKRPDADIVFASVATLARRQHLQTLAVDHFDYIVIDEFHHAAAASYHKLLEHFRPRFLLGLTATPDRTDGAEILELCGDNLVARVDIHEGIARGLLCPFQYYGVADELDYTNIPWRGGRFDLDALAAKAATRERAAQALREYRQHAPGLRRALVFCCSVAHADFTAAYFAEHGVTAVAVHSGPQSAPRADSIRKLGAGEIEAIVTVDLFNEGVDIPDVDTVLMLRPTESPIIFLQQLGRGLRKGSRGKPALRVIDFIGNHRGFLVKPRALCALLGTDVTAAQAVARLRAHELELPAGCSVDIELEALAFLERWVHPPPGDALVRAYQQFCDEHARRPTARELFAANGTLRPAEERRRTWFDFVGSMSGLSPEEQGVLNARRDWFIDLSGTPMSRSYKMVTLEVLNDVGALHRSISVPELAERCREHLRSRPQLRGELREHEVAGGDLGDFVRRWREMPLRIFDRAQGFSRRWFELRGDEFVSCLEVAAGDREVFDRMTAEMVDYRLAKYLATPAAAGRLVPLGGLPMDLSHSDRKPILRFDRDKYPAMPEGEVTVEVDGEALLFYFRKIAVNVVTVQAGGPNVLGDRMRRWFGPDAGLPGTRHRVLLHAEGHGWRLAPVRGVTVVQLPFYELKVACGLPAGQYGDAPERQVAVRSARRVDAARHFVVRASGDSMDGGAHPIRDGDLVLCEWLSGSRPEDVEGRPVLVTAATAEEHLAAIKVPSRRDGAWVLSSANPAHPDLMIDTGTEWRAVARVVEVVEAT